MSCSFVPSSSILANPTLTFTDWNDEQICSMEKVGNLKARSLWEASRPDNVVVNDV